MADFEAFLAEVRGRVRVERAEWGERSLERPLAELIDEIGAELADVASSSAILWSRLQGLRDAAARFEGAGPESVRLCGADREQALATIGGARE